MARKSTTKVDHANADLWLSTRIRDAGIGANDAEVIRPRGVAREPQADDAFARFYSVRFPPAFRVAGLEWYTYSGPQVRAVMLVCAREDDRLARVMFRLDANGAVVAHAYGIAVTEHMMAFAKKQLPKLTKEIKLHRDMPAKGKTSR